MLKATVHCDAIQQKYKIGDFQCPIKVIKFDKTIKKILSAEICKLDNRKSILFKKISPLKNHEKLPNGKSSCDEKANDETESSSKILPPAASEESKNIKLPNACDCSDETNYLKTDSVGLASDNETTTSISSGIKTNVTEFPS